MRVPFDFPNVDFFFFVCVLGKRRVERESLIFFLCFCLLRYFYLNQCSFLTNFLLQVFAINLLG